MDATQRYDSGRPGERTAAPAALRTGPRELPAPSLLEAIERALCEVHHLVRNHATLAVLEMQRAGLGLARLIALTLAIAVLGVTAWLAVVIALIVWTAGESLSWPAVLLIVAGLNSVLALGLSLWAKRFISEVPFAATLRQLGSDRNQTTGPTDHATVR